MTSLNPTLLEGGSMISSIQNDDIIALDYHQLLFNFLRLLRFDSSSMSAKHRMKFDKDMFKLPNPKAFQLICHFLFHKLDHQKANEIFRDVWPIVDKKQEAQFRKKVQQWFYQIQEVMLSNSFNLKYPRFILVLIFSDQQRFFVPSHKFVNILISWWWQICPIDVCPIFTYPAQ